MSSYLNVNFATQARTTPGVGERTRTNPDAGEQARTELPVSCRCYIKPDSPAHSRIADGNSVVWAYTMNP
jgi:hypothetical protein